MTPQKKRTRSQERKEAFENKKEKEKDDSPNFLLKLYQILENKDYQDIIHWSENGQYFVVQNLHDFTERVLPQYYKHNNYSSFVRQLNMYDFHKKRSSQNEHIFQHKKFLRDQIDSIKSIKRKNKKDFQSNDNNNEQALIEYCNNDLLSKKATKNSLEKALNHLIKSVKDTNEKQNELETKIKTLGQQNEDILTQNQQMLEEMLSKTEYNQKLEAVVYFIYEMTKKPSVKSGDGKNALMSNQIIDDEKNLIKSQEYQPFQNMVSQNNIVELENTDSFKSFLEKYLKQKKHGSNLPMLLASGEDVNDTFNHQMVPLQKSSPIRKSFYDCSKGSPTLYSPNRRPVQYSRKPNNQSLSFNDEVFKNSALKQLMPQNIHTNFNVSPKNDNINLKSEENHLQLLENECSNPSIHSQNMFDLDFNLENSDINDTQNDKKESPFFDDD